MYVYVYSSLDHLWTTGFYDPAGHWHPDRDFSTEEEATARVHWLNGGCRCHPSISVSDTIASDPPWRACLPTAQEIARMTQDRLRSR